jgi:hypothetical protein
MWRVDLGALLNYHHDKLLTQFCASVLAKQWDFCHLQYILLHQNLIIYWIEHFMCTNIYDLCMYGNVCVCVLFLKSCIVCDRKHPLRALFQVVLSALSFAQKSTVAWIKRRVILSWADFVVCKSSCAKQWEIIPGRRATKNQTKGAARAKTEGVCHQQCSLKYPANALKILYSYLSKVKSYHCATNYKKTAHSQNSVSQKLRRHVNYTLCF